MKPSLLRPGMNQWPPFLLAGIHVTEISPDWRRVRVELRTRPWNRNFVGTHFGGNLFANLGKRGGRLGNHRGHVEQDEGLAGGQFGDLGILAFLHAEGGGQHAHQLGARQEGPARCDQPGYLGSHRAALSSVGGLLPEPVWYP